MYKIDHINRYVRSVDKTVTFYTQALGFLLIDDGIKADGKPYAVLRSVDHLLFVSESDKYIESQCPNFRHVGYCVANVEEILRDLKGKVYAPQEATCVIKPYSKQVYITDPDGVEIDLIQWTDKVDFFKTCKYMKD